MILIARLIILGELVLPYWDTTTATLRAMGYSRAINDVTTSEAENVDIHPEDQLFTTTFRTKKDEKFAILVFLRDDRSRMVVIGCDGGCSNVWRRWRRSLTCTAQGDNRWICMDTDRQSLSV